MPIAAGQLDRQIQLQRNTAAGGTEEFGDESVNWSTFATVWARVTSQPGSETFQTQQRTNKQETVFRIRYRGDVDPKVRIVYQGMAYEVLDVVEPAESRRREFLDVRAYAREVVPKAVS